LIVRGSISTPGFIIPLESSSCLAWHLARRPHPAGLDGAGAVRRLHIAEAVSYRRQPPRQAMAA
jgi:hypothetical protein